MMVVRYFVMLARERSENQFDRTSYRTDLPATLPLTVSFSGECS